MENKKYIIREYSPDACELSWYFDDDGLTKEGNGEYCDNLFIVQRDRWGHVDGFNMKEYKSVMDCARSILDGFEDVRDPANSYNWTGYKSYKECMEDFGIPYNSRKCHALKEWAKNADEDRPEDIAAFLTITTGKKWDVTGVYGYCQGDYVEIVYCPEYYRNGVQNYGEVWMGCAKEFCVIELGEDGEEIDRCGGYIVADCEAWRDEDYKRHVCEWAGIDESETVLEMFDGYIQTAKYRTA